MAGDGLRRCRRCLTALARDNDETLCGACRSSRRGLSGAEELPATFWRHDVILEAVAERHLGRLIRAYRHHPNHGRRPLPQELVAAWLGLSQGQLSRIENGPPPQSLDRLLTWAGALKIPPHLLWYTAADDDATAPNDLSPRAVAVRQISEGHADDVFDLLRDQWHLLVRADNLLGPRFALAGVLEHLAAVRQLASRLRGQQWRAATALTAQYAESASWLYEDAGDPVRARAWNGAALGWAHDADDVPMQVWTLYRRSQQAADAGQVESAVRLAEAGRPHEHALPSPMRAALRVQEAHARALDCEFAAAQTLLDQAHDWARADDAGDARTGHGAFCTPAYVEVHRALFLHLAGDPMSAVAVYRSALAAMPAVYQRDQALALAGLAAAHVATDQPDEAAGAATEALRLARATGSGRVERQLVTVGAALTRHGRSPAIAAFLHDLTSAEA
jgi:transcriptional regulator with XRE-family HTH domain